MLDEWTLKNDGDSFEQCYWEYFKLLFPNYEKFWSEFITPMTCRNDLPREHELWLHFRMDVNPDLQNIAMAHYTIFRCLAANQDIMNFNLSVEKNFRAVFQESFDMFYANLGTIVDMVSNIFFYVAKFQVQLKVRAEFLKEKTEIELENDFNQFIKKEYRSRLEEFSRRKRPVNIVFHDRKDFIEHILGKVSEVTEFNRFSNEIVKRIRNVALHNPVVGSCGTRVPKPEKIEKYYLWGDLFYNRDNSDFIDRNELFDNHFQKIQKLLNSLWDKLVREFKVLSNNKEYKKMLGSVPK